MPSGTTYNPPNVNSLIKTALSFNGQGVVNVACTAGTTTNLDYLIPDDNLITGLEIITNGGNYGDHATVQVVDTTGFTGYPAGTVLNQVATNWYVSPTYDQQYDIIYPAKLITGLTLRVVYTSTGVNPVFVAINYKLHKVLI